MYLPESPRWLMSQGRFEEVNRIMTECARVNGKELPPDLLPQLEVNSYNFFFLFFFIEARLYSIGQDHKVQDHKARRWP